MSVPDILYGARRQLAPYAISVPDNAKADRVAGTKYATTPDIGESGSLVPGYAYVSAGYDIGMA